MLLVIGGVPSSHGFEPVLLSEESVDAENFKTVSKNLNNRFLSRGVDDGSNLSTLTFKAIGIVFSLWPRIHDEFSLIIARVNDFLKESSL